MTHRLLALGLAAVLAAGCGKPDSAAPAADQPLTVEQWKAMPAQVKYDIDTLDRLRQADPKLREQRDWDKFTRDVVLPAKKKDQAAGGK